jgi:hypothetical protein
MTTPAHRRNELAVLLGQMRAQPSRDWTTAKGRAFILARLLARDPGPHDNRAAATRK